MYMYTYTDASTNTSREPPSWTWRTRFEATVDEGAGDLV